MTGPELPELPVVSVTDVPGGVVVFVRVQPGARRTEATGVHDGALSVRVAAPPVDGKANDALIAFLAKAFDVRRSAVTIRSGSTSRRKRVRIDGIDRAAASDVVTMLVVSGTRG